MNDETKKSVSVTKVCENIDIIESIEVNQESGDPWFVEEIVVEMPADPKKSTEKKAEKIKVG